MRPQHHSVPPGGAYRFLEASDPVNTGALKLVVNAEHPEHGAYFHAILEATTSPWPHSRNEFASLAILLRCVSAFVSHCAPSVPLDNAW